MIFTSPAPLFVCDNCLTLFSSDTVVPCPMKGCRSDKVNRITLDAVYSRIPVQAVEYMTDARNWGNITRSIHNARQTGSFKFGWMGTCLIKWEGYIQFRGEDVYVTGWTASLENPPNQWTVGKG